MIKAVLLSYHAKRTRMVCAHSQDANSEAAKELLAEAELMRQLEFVNVVRCLGVSEKDVADGSIFVLLEFMALGDLHTRLEKNGREMRLAERLWYGHQIAQGMAYLSMKGVAFVACSSCYVHANSARPGLKGN